MTKVIITVAIAVFLLAYFLLAADVLPSAPAATFTKPATVSSH